jgi:hypothetical protein
VLLTSQENSGHRACACARTGSGEICDDDVSSVAFQHRGSFVLSIICCCGDDAADALRGKTVSVKRQRAASLVVLVVGLLMASPLAANAATNQLSGTAVYDAVACPGPPAGYGDFTSYPGVDMGVDPEGSLVGCLYAKVNFDEDTKLTPSGVYVESGREVFVGSLNGGPVGTFETTYKFESKWDPDPTPPGVELFGRCQHPIVKGSGTGGFAGATGRLDFKDIIEEGNFDYRGHISLG